jgi:hypothetical protein
LRCLQCYARRNGGVNETNCRHWQPALFADDPAAALQDALKKFRENEGWKVGVDSCVALVDRRLGVHQARQETSLPDFRRPRL